MSAIVTVERVRTFEEEPLHYSADAAELGWDPGRWPQTIETDLGNGTPLTLTELNDSCGRYSQLDGDVTLTVWND